ncbi:uncharacterized protein LOC129228274 [Uloborus diversus]|uniref:uncharacterized protein LOC129228274 n=1 Tax=Uloborus diversus TaxID=327109 RepID=UPI00240A76AC|nr:uncharacterized protein LOC129228274 [Uloborus diversus]
MFAEALLAMLLSTSGVICLKLVHASSPTESPSDSEENYYPCFNDLNCALGAEKKAQIQACVHLLQNESKDQVFQLIRDASKGFITTNTIEGIQEEFCTTEKFRRREGFNTMVTLTYDYFMTNCKDSSDICENIQDSMKCVLDIINETFEEKKCGKIHDLQKGKMK